MDLYANKQSQSGVVLGGIGTGSVELRPDGEFHLWQIYNTPRWTTNARERTVDDGEGSVGALSFWIRTEDADGRVLLRKLGLRTSDDDFTYRMYPRNRTVEGIRFRGRFPTCELCYEDSVLPIRVALKATAPFVPHEAAASGTPGFYLDFTVENPTDRPIRCDLLCRMESGFPGMEDRRATVEGRDRCRTVLMRSGNNSVALSLAGGDQCHAIAADYSRYLREYVARSRYGVTQESILFDFIERGTLPDASVGQPITPLSEDELEEKSPAELEKICLELQKYPFAESILRRVARFMPGYPSGREQCLDYIAACYAQLPRLGDFGSSALSTGCDLPPGGRRQFSAVYSWYFPDHVGEDGRLLGHFYATRFDDAGQVADYLRRNSAEIRDRAQSFAELLYDTSLPEIFPDAWSCHLSTIVRSSWWLRDGRFGIWEGLGYCGFHTTDISYHATFGLLALFPELELGQMEMGAAYQRSDGRVHHFFTPDLYHVDDGFHRVDMNMQFVLMVARDYLFTGDRGYLDRMWTPVCKAMASTAALDGDGDGLPDRETRRNTYDSWNFEGTPTYLAILWLSALSAAIVLAGQMGDRERSNDWSRTLEKGRASLEQKLWNGEYYDLWVDGDRRDASLMSDQLDGEWFLRTAGIGKNLSDDRLRAVLRVILRNNFDPESGLVNASCPEGMPTTLATYQNCQAEARWTGIGYLIASLALSLGDFDSAEQLVGEIHRSQAGFGLFWDHWECGHHYSRPMSSYATLLSASGLTVDRAQGILRIEPPLPGNLRLPIVTVDAVGSLLRSGRELRILAMQGSFETRELIFTFDCPGNSRKPNLFCRRTDGRESLPALRELGEGRWSLRFEDRAVWSELTIRFE